MYLSHSRPQDEEMLTAWTAFAWEDRGVGAPSCSQQDGRGGFTCTRPRGHTGPHVALGREGVNYSAWSDGPPVWPPGKEPPPATPEQLAALHALTDVFR